MQWIPSRGDDAEFRDHLRTFASVFPHVTVFRGPGGYGQFMLGAMAQIECDRAAIREVLGRPGVLADVSSAFDSPAATVDDWVAEIIGLPWLSGPASRRLRRPRPIDHGR